MAEPFDTVAASLVSIIEQLRDGVITTEDAAEAISPLLVDLAPDQWAQLATVQQALGRVSGTFFTDGPPSPILGKVGSTAIDMAAKLFYGPKTNEDGWGAGEPFVGADGPDGRSYADVARFIGAIYGITIAPTATDLEVLEAVADAAAAIVDEAALDQIEAAGDAQRALIAMTPGFDALYPNAYATALPKGVTSGTIGGTTITGATPGTYALTAVGGSITGVAANLVVTSPTAATIVITNPGLGTGTTPPTWANPAGANLPVGTTLTAVVGNRVPTTGRYLALSADGLSLQCYQNDGTATPLALAGVALRTKAFLDAVIDTANDTRSGFLGGYADLAGRRLLAFSKTDGRPIFMIGGDVAARLDSAEAAATLVDEDRSGWLWAVQSPDGRILAGMDRFSARLWVGPRDVGGDLATLKADVAALETAVYSASSRDLILAGDSMSYVGAAFHTAVGSAMPDRLIYNVGSPGQQTKSIAIAFGVPDLLTLTPTGSVLPTSGTAACAYSFHFLHTNSCARVEVTDEIGRAVVCWVARDGAGGYTIRPETYPASPIRLQTPARARVISLMAAGTDPSAAQALDPLYDKVLCIRAGRNDTAYDKAYDGPALVALIQRMAALMRSGKVVVMGPTNGRGDVPTAQGGVSATLTEAQSQQNLANTIDMNGRLRAAFHSASASPMAQFAANGGTTDRTVNGATYAVSNDTVLGGDGIHEITAGGALTADLLKTTLTAEGY